MGGFNVNLYELIVSALNCRHFVQVCFIEKNIVIYIISYNITS